ncbi:Gfo/Idh/MocA family protein [Streptomyces sp. H39-S7]|uniref:Gfo/Idh/MocA family protein n=1 Tax=Streptomyces sp. H39-S7 TaxID=3004357 RepID=UPI0022AE99C1|nr:Gfo/Idh/MocA family oxidoreductase [Streptomyces sp. H39-S7]MCZ4121784.1 Gfo/Idh/MocA family oxidoreductase [Streptomyces sp. H39-S7]
MSEPEPAPGVLRLGVLGCADFAWRKMLPAIATVPGLRVTALASRDPAKAARFAERFGGEPVTGYEALLERDDVDAVYVVLPTGLHHAWTLRALTAGKHVLAEKSLTTGAGEAAELVAAARDSGLWLMENFLFLHHSQHAAVRERIAAGAIGEPRVFSSAFGVPPRPDGDIRNSPELGGGALLDVGAYTVRAATYFLGPDLTLAGSQLRIDGRTGVDVGGSALFHTPAGVAAELSFGFDSSYRTTYALWGSEGRISVDRAFTPPADLLPAVRWERQDAVEDVELPADDQYANGARAFADRVLTGAPFDAYGESLVRQAALLERIRDEAHRVTV